MTTPSDIAMVAADLNRPPDLTSSSSFASQPSLDGLLIPPGPDVDSLPRKRPREALVTPLSHVPENVSKGSAPKVAASQTHYPKDFTDIARMLDGVLKTASAPSSTATNVSGKPKKLASTPNPLGDITNQGSGKGVTKGVKTKSTAAVLEGLVSVPVSYANPIFEANTPIQPAGSASRMVKGKNKSTRLVKPTQAVEITTGKPKSKSYVPRGLQKPPYEQGVVSPMDGPTEEEDAGEAGLFRL
ncbi:hypothetical protein LINPERPRIM_LOCUS21338 [Linum perenne]